MLSRAKLLPVFTGLLLSVSAAPEQALAAPDWSELLDRNGGSGVDFGVVIGNDRRFARNPNRSFAPASTSKVITAAAALALLGRDFRYETRLEWLQPSSQAPHRISRLALIGSGDPTWGMSELGETFMTRIDEIVNRLVAQGVTEIAGAVEVRSSDSRWDRLRYPSGWEDEDKTACYGALAQSFNLDINCAIYVITDMNEGHWESPEVPIQVAHELRSGTETRIEVLPPASADQPDTRFRIRGTWKKGATPARLVLPIADTQAWIRNLLLKKLNERGIKRVAEAPFDARPKAHSISLYSASLAEILKPFLKKSLNVLGDALIKTIGARLGSEDADLTRAGAEIIHGFVSSVTDEGSDIRLLDGSGLSRENSVTPSALQSFMLNLTRHEYFPSIFDALAVAGVDGTLENRMKGTPAEGVFHGKTGTLTGAYNLVGYIPRFDASSRKWAYETLIVLTDTTAEKRSVATSAADRVAAALSGD